MVAVILEHITHNVVTYAYESLPIMLALCLNLAYISCIDKFALSACISYRNLLS